MNVFVTLFLSLVVPFDLCVLSAMCDDSESLHASPFLYRLLRLTDIFSSFRSSLSVRVADGKLYHPDGAWDLDTIYVTVYSKRKWHRQNWLRVRCLFFLPCTAAPLDVKRKGVSEQADESIITSIGQAKTQRLDYGQDAPTIVDEEDNDSDRRCVDLIVLGISYRSIEADVKSCFEAFGELVFCEVRSLHGEMERIQFI